jgi:hypothetical protein
MGTNPRMLVVWPKVALVKAISALGLFFSSISII